MIRTFVLSLAILGRSCVPHRVVEGVRVSSAGDCGTVAAVSSPRFPLDEWHVLVRFDDGRLDDLSPTFVHVEDCPLPEDL